MCQELTPFPHILRKKFVTTIARIVASDTGVLDVVPHLETLETLSASIVDVLGIGNELRGRRRSIGGRHFDVEDGLMVQGAMAKAVVVSS